MNWTNGHVVITAFTAPQENSPLLSKMMTNCKGQQTEEQMSFERGSTKPKEMKVQMVLQLHSKAKMKGTLLPLFLPSLLLEQLFNISSNPTPTPFSLILIVDYMSLSRLCPSTIFGPLLSISRYTIISAHCMSIHSYLSNIWSKREREREQERLTDRG